MKSSKINQIMIWILNSASHGPGLWQKPTMAKGARSTNAGFKAELVPAHDTFLFWSTRLDEWWPAESEFYRLDTAPQVKSTRCGLTRITTHKSRDPFIPSLPIRSGWPIVDDATTRIQSSIIVLCLIFGQDSPPPNFWELRLIDWFSVLKKKKNRSGFFLIPMEGSHCPRDGSSQ